MQPLGHRSAAIGVAMDVGMGWGTGLGMREQIYGYVLCVNKLCVLEQKVEACIVVLCTRVGCARGGSAGT